MDDLTLTFAQPSVPLSINKARHWAATRRRLRPWHDLAWAYTRQALQQAARAGRPYVQGPVTVQVTLEFVGERRRDPHNFTGTVVKAIVDGLKDAGLVPDDTPNWVTVADPQVRVIKRGQPPTATVAVRPRPPQETP